MKTSQLYRLEVAPLIILPLGKSPLFSYISQTAVPLGSLVAISFGKRSLEGVVFGCAPLPGKAPLWMKPITKVIREQMLTEHQLDLARFVSAEYFTSLGKTLKHFLPKRMSIKKGKQLTRKVKPVRLEKGDALILQKFLNLKKSIVGYLDVYTLQDTERAFSQIAKKNAAEKKQTLILVPEIMAVPALRTALEKYFPEESIAVLHSKVSDKAYYQAWENIRGGDAQVILATRQGLFAPFCNLGAIVVFDEGDESYKQWAMSPRYDGGRVAKELARMTGAKLLLTSGTPGVESLYHIRKKEYKALTPLSHFPPLMPSLSIVNLRLERFRKNYSPLSLELITALEETRRRGEQALLYIHRQGLNAFSVCENCKQILRCPKTHHALSSTTDGAYRCPGCAYISSTFPSCPHCGHLSFRHVGFGTERVEREIKKLFPGARVFRADKTTLRTEKQIEKFYQEASRGNIDILIGTQAILKSHALPKLSLIGMMDADSLLSFPDFRADEKLFQVLWRFRKHTVKDGSRPLPPKIVVQTFHPESTFFQNITSSDTETFLQKILREREDLFYPPCARMYVVTCHGSIEKKVVASIQVLGQDLEALLVEDKQHYRLSIPEKARYLFSKKTFSCSLIIRIPANQTLPVSVKTYLEKMPLTDSIDVDPLSLS
jgi:primosomal protein N'